MFVDGLFCGLESEAYLTGQDSATPPPAVTSPKTAAMKPPSSKPQSVVPPGKPQPIRLHSGGTRDGTQSASGSSSTGRSTGLGDKGRAGGTSGDRRYSEDIRSREVDKMGAHPCPFYLPLSCLPFLHYWLQVDDDDRDFRRSRTRGGKSGEGKMRGSRGSVRGGGRGEEGGTVSREPDSSTGGGRRFVETEGGKGRGMAVSTSGDHRGKRKREGEIGGGVSSTGGRSGEGGGKRPVKDKTGSWQEERRYGLSVN